MNNATHTAELRKPASFWKTSTHVALCWLLLWSQLSQAALTDLSSVPLASSTSAQVKPNIMYLMDTSGSMAWSHMPDDEERHISRVGYKNNICNSMYYNPNSTYTLPKKADGTNYPTPSFTGAYYDGYVNTATTVDLSASFRAYDSSTLSGSSNDTAQAAYYYTYSGGQKLVWHGAPCTQTIGASPFTASGQSAPGSATDTLAPPAPFFTLTNVGASAGSLYTAGLAGNYKYQITAFNNIGESAPSALSSAVAIAAGEGVQIVITDNGGSVPATGYRIYRTAAGGSTTTSIYSVERAFVNSVPQATTTMVDLNNPGTWTKVLVNSTSGIAGSDERQNFANWYSYYRTRIMMMKSAATRAFIQLTDSYRVGLVTISPGNPVSSSKYLKIDDFNSAHRTSWFSKLTSQTVANSTPNREALARVGRHFAGKTDGINSGMADDPMQYSCQQNFVILTTDGYWNGNAGVDLTGSAIGNADGSYSATPPPMWDGASDGTSVVTTKSNVYNPNVTCTARQQRTQQVQRRTIQNTQSTAQIRQSTAQTLETRTQTLETKVQTLQTRTQTMQTNTQTMDTRTQTLKTATQTMKTATQTMKTATQTLKGTTSTINGTATIVFTNVSSGAVLTAILINGVDRLNIASITATPSGGGGGVSRKLNMKNAIVAAGLTNSYTIAASGTCSAAATPFPSCLSNSDTYIKIMAPLGSGTTITSASLTTTTASITAPITTSNTGVVAGTITVTPAPADPATCAAGTLISGNTRTVTTCTAGPNTFATAAVQSTTCPSSQPASLGNSWTATTCAPGPNTFASAAVQAGTCAAQTETAPNWTTITCTPGPNTFATAAVQPGTCAAQTGTAPNWTTITCTPGPNTQAATAVQTCSPVTATAPNWTAVTCTPGPNTLAATAVSSCSPVTAIAPTWTTTTCTPGPNTQAATAVSSCSPVTAIAPTWTTTTCAPGPNTQAATAVSSCSPVTATAPNWTTTSCAAGPNTQAATGVSSCSPVSATAPTWTATTCSNATTTNVPVASCSPAIAAAGNAWVTTTCNTVATGPTNIGTCTPIVAGAGNSFTATTCAVASDTNWVDVSSCSASNPGSGPTVTCQTADTGFVEVDSCTASSGSGRTVTCQNGTANAGRKIQYTSTTTVATTLLSGGAPVGSPITTTTVGSPVDVTGICYQTRSIPAPPAAGVPGPSTPPFPPSGCSAWPCTVVTSAPSGGSSGSLADVAAYYYNTDLRPTMTDNVPTSGTGTEADTANWQHMTTFTMGLGLSGTLTYRSDYKTANVGDFQDVREVAKLWPVPVNDDPTALDDLWHAAVNGRGQFFSAADPDSVVSGLLNALAGISARVASAAAAATSNLEPVAGDNFAYTAKYVTTKWTGELEAHEIDLSTGEVKTAIIWSAQSKLDARTRNYCDNRAIYLFRSGATDNLTNLTWNTQTCDVSGNPTGTAVTDLNATEQANFNSSKVALFSQYGSMTDGTGSPVTADQRGLAAGANMVNYVRGQRGYENFVANDQSKLYRTRENVLGDIVNAQPVYVKAPFASYTDSGYSAYKTAKSTRTPMVFVAANDGMLHAFYAGTSTSDTTGGEEAWTFIPSMVLPNLYKLADTNYSNNHQYSVDGTPSVGDFYDSTAGEWKTLLVAGLNGGGKGYYALDVTTPAAPKAMWEFKWSDTCYDDSNPASRASTGGADCHIGYTFSNPILSKARVKDTNSDGVIDALDTEQWVVLVTSGYNNVNSPAKAGDGLGYLYVLDAATGKIYFKIATTAGSATTPSGLNHINNWVENTLADNSTVRVYGGDLLGNVWRFDINDTIAPSGREATKVAELCTGTCNGLNYQPITTRPELAESGGSPMVFVATGSMLGSTDLSINTAQSIYGIVDPISTTPYVDLRASLKPLTMAQVGSGSSATRTISCTGTSAQCNSTAGWYVDLPLTGERVNVDMKLQLGTLVVASNIPATDACSIGGTSWLNFFNYGTGEHVANSAGGKVAQFLSNSLAVGLNIVRLPSGKTVVITTTSDAKQTTIGAPFDIPPPSGKRISWREITQ